MFEHVRQVLDPEGSVINGDLAETIVQAQRAAAEGHLAVARNALKEDGIAHVVAARWLRRRRSAAE